MVVVDGGGGAGVALGRAVGAVRTLGKLGTLVQWKGAELAGVGSTQALYRGLCTGISLAGGDVVGTGQRPVAVAASPQRFAAAFGRCAEHAGGAGALEPELLHAAPTRDDR